MLPFAATVTSHNDGLTARRAVLPAGSVLASLPPIGLLKSYHRPATPCFFPIEQQQHIQQSLRISQQQQLVQQPPVAALAPKDSKLPQIKAFEPRLAGQRPTCIFSYVENPEPRGS